MSTPRRVSSFIVRVMILCSTACSASSVGAGTSTNSGAPSLPRWYTPSVLRQFDIGGQVLSLYSFENDVIRPATRARNDPRVHFALNCSAVSCPVMPRAPFAADALDAELERETRAFFARPENFSVDAEQRTVWLSELLDFYPEDFVPRPAVSLLAYANRYPPQPAPLDFSVRFTPYDWTVANSRRPR